MLSTRQLSLAGARHPPSSSAAAAPVDGGVRRALPVAAFAAAAAGSSAPRPAIATRRRQALHVARFQPQQQHHDAVAVTTEQPPPQSPPPPPAAAAAVSVGARAALTSDPGPGGAAAPERAGVGVAVSVPEYAVSIAYRSEGRPLERCAAIWAHAGHSGWAHTTDVPLARCADDPTVWRGVYRVPISQLADPARLDVQLVFKGVHGDGNGNGNGSNGQEEWDNNGGDNWGAAVELAPDGLAPPPSSPAALRALASALLVRLDGLAAAGLVNAEQWGVLRLKAWAGDFGLLRAFKQAAGVADDGALAALLLSRFGFLRRPGLHVVHIASEMVPVAKVGGLGDVVTGLAKAHQKR